MTNLAIAMQHWNQGEPAPLDVAVGLMSEGYEVDSLEDKYMNAKGHNDE